MRMCMLVELRRGEGGGGGGAFAVFFFFPRFDMFFCSMTYRRTHQTEHIDHHHHFYILCTFQFIRTLHTICNITVPTYLAYIIIQPMARG